MILGAAFPFLPLTSAAPPVVGGSFANGYGFARFRVLPHWIHGAPAGGTAWVRYRATGNELRSVANGGKVQNDAAWPDHRIEDALGRPIAYDRESWSATTGEFRAWLRLTGLRPGEHFLLGHYYGKAAITADEAAPAACWAGYDQVVDLADGLDRTGNARHLTLSLVTPATLLNASAGDFG